ncbi:type I secretion system permease/ATPase [Tardiphaga sp.]|jgi:PrtD family type I secretion system ABC transporter|uniref:type I secretion system permease/ATPase n=1 Tax=Tardiphaga sp. TaxID=1926292 RepID=UPI0037D9BE92
MSLTPRAPSQKGELGAAFSACRSAFIWIAFFSALINVLMLTSSFFMLQVYDRVLASHSVPTLVGLCILAGILYVFLALFDVVRQRILTRIGLRLDEQVSGRIYETILTMPVRSSQHGEWKYPLRDLDSLRSFLSSLGPTVVFDLPWFPVYLAICYAFHVWIGVAATAGALVLIAFTIVIERNTKVAVQEATSLGSARNGSAESGRRNAEVINALGMTGRLAARWQTVNSDYLDSHRRASDIGGGLGAASKIFRMALQSGILAIGAWLVIRQEATGGVIIAASILSSRALAPIELAISSWKSFVGARQSWKRLSDMLDHFPDRSAMFELPAPTALLSVESLSVAPPGKQKLVVHDASFQVRAGSAVGVIGANASGKSSLIRCLVGAWMPAVGKVRLDGGPLDQWNPILLGRHIGYLPQDVELIDGTVSENISRFMPDAPATDVVEAARNAGTHEMIMNLPEGYDTRIGHQDAALSSGQRQRIALARALYGNPFLVVLDEPNSNLDSEGEQALTEAIVGVRRRDGIVVVVAHRAAAISGVDLLLLMSNGRIQSFGPRDEVLSRLQKPALKSVTA